MTEDEDQATGAERIINKVAEHLVQRRLAAPAIFALESMKPLSFIASQGLLALEPFITSVLSIPDYKAFREMLEDRENVETLLQRIEQLEDERLGGEESG